MELGHKPFAQYIFRVWGGELRNKLGFHVCVPSTLLIQPSLPYNRILVGRMHKVELVPSMTSHSQSPEDSAKTI